MRQSFISTLSTKKEEEFWKQFFDEVDKRHFLKAKFIVGNFGLHIYSKYLKEGTKSYSLMYSCTDILRMNNEGYNGRKWDGLERLKYWFTNHDLAEKFYSELNKKNLIFTVKKNVEIIDVPELLKQKTPSTLNKELFQCVDLFK